MDDIKKDVVFFGKTDFRNSDRIFGIKRVDRRQHMYVIGKTGTGKTTLLRNMLIQDIANGEGVCLVDPHGEVVEDLLKMIPKKRLDDVVYFNPGDPDYHIGFNPLEMTDPKYKHLIASGLMGIFTKIWAGVWSARMEYILSNSILALLDTPGSTLLGVTRLLVDKEFRMKIVANVQDPIVKAFWVQEFETWKEQFRNEAVTPILNKVGQFLSTPLVRNIVGQPKSTIDIFNLMNEGKILLVNVSKGRIGEDNSALLGAMIITKIQLSAMDRIRVPEDERVDFYLYVDEFQNFATDSFANILSEARKYRLCLTMAHQYVGQLVTDASTRVRDAIFGNVGTMLIMRVGATDADFLTKELEPEFTSQDMVNLPNRRIFIKLMVDGVTSRPFSGNTLAPIKLQYDSATEDEVIKNSRKKYAKPRYQVEEEINLWSDVMNASRSGASAPVKSFRPLESLPERSKEYPRPQRATEEGSAPPPQRRDERPRDSVKPEYAAPNKPQEARREAAPVSKPNEPASQNGPVISLKDLLLRKEKEGKEKKPAALDIDMTKRMISDAMRPAPKDDSEESIPKI